MAFSTPLPDWLTAAQACDVLGVDPLSPVPDYDTMHRYIRNLQMLLHPDRLSFGGDAARAQEELGIEFKALRAVENYLFPEKGTEWKYKISIQTLFNLANQSRCWVSRWNPHKLEGGDMFEPLPAWTRWRSTQSDYCTVPSLTDQSFAGYKSVYKPAVREYERTGKLRFVE
ncbi:hypothetical protein SLS58_005412 [Diplodia intermedia]|uniref:J domain-containing protein n=1 Tax=Diplodia intermedia TaxID=856260 RepID=A0ABR3TRB1_9PEZI